MRGIISRYLERGINVLDEDKLKKCACNELIKVFGKKYLQDNYATTIKTRAFLNDGTYMFFVGIKGESDLPGRKGNEKGWVVYGLVCLDAHTGELKDVLVHPERLQALQRNNILRLLVYLCCTIEA